MILDRRAWIAGAGSALLLPRAARAAETSTLLDRAATLPAAEGLKLLAGATSADPHLALDLRTARAGLAIDAALARLGAPPRSALKSWVATRAGHEGLASDPDGEQLYALLAQRSAGTIDVPIAERRLRLTLDRLHDDARRLFTSLGRWRGSVGASFEAIWHDERFLYPDDLSGRDAAIRDMNAELSRLRAVTDRFVEPVPTVALDVSIRSLSAAEIAAGRGGYRDQPADGAPAAYIVDLKDIRKRPSWTLPSVVAHETLPGHLLQGSIERARMPHPLRLDYAAAFVEGWAVYAEAIIPGFSPLAQLGRIHWLLFRTARALADIGVHRHGWRSDEACAWLRKWQGVPVYFAPFENEITRIVREPGIRLGEASVWLAIVDAVQRRGQNDMRGAYRHILGTGRKRLESLTS